MGALGTLLLECVRVAGRCRMPLVPSMAGGAPPTLGPAPLPLPAADCRRLPLTPAACRSPHAPCSLPAAYHMPPPCLPAHLPACRQDLGVFAQRAGDGRPLQDARVQAQSDPGQPQGACCLAGPCLCLPSSQFTRLPSSQFTQACAWAVQLAGAACRRRVQRTMQSQRDANTRPVGLTRKVMLPLLVVLPARAAVLFGDPAEPQERHAGVDHQ